MLIIAGRAAGRNCTVSRGTRLTMHYPQFNCRLVTAACLFLFADVLLAQTLTRVQYLANEGVMVAHEETKVLFDPLYDNSYNTYQVVPDSIRAAIFAGSAPYDGIDAVFVSHYHGDHFSAEDLLRLMRSHEGIALYAPAQAVAAIRAIAADEDAGIFARATGFDLEYGDAPMFVRTDGLLVEAAYVPHSGWPTRRTDVQNIAFRVTLNDNSTVLHMGDADAKLVHYTGDPAYWEERNIDLALPPYWYFLSEDGREVLENYVNVENSIGIHVPAEFSDPANIPQELEAYELFTRPGEGRSFIGSQ